MSNYLISILGPTASGKTFVSIELAKRYGVHILSCDSRQIYKGIPIGTAAPTIDELSQAPHHFISEKDLNENYSCGRYETDALALLDKLYSEHNVAIMCGGSMLYADAVHNGIDDLPQADEELRTQLWEQYEKEGIESIRSSLRLLDPEYCEHADMRNHKRMIHALEMCIISGRPYTSMLGGTKKQRPFEIIKIGIQTERDILYDRINKRTFKMIEDGLEDEAKSVISMRNVPALNTVGYKEMFRYLDGEWSLDFAISEIQKNTRRYAKKQITWWKRDNSIKWFNKSDIDGMTQYIDSIVRKEKP